MADLNSLPPAVRAKVEELIASLTAQGGTVVEVPAVGGLPAFLGVEAAPEPVALSHHVPVTGQAVSVP